MGRPAKRGRSRGRRLMGRRACDAGTGLGHGDARRRPRCPAAPACRPKQACRRAGDDRPAGSRSGSGELGFHVGVEHGTSLFVFGNGRSRAPGSVAVPARRPFSCGFRSYRPDQRGPSAWRSPLGRADFAGARPRTGRPSGGAAFRNVAADPLSCTAMVLIGLGRLRVPHSARPGLALGDQHLEETGRWCGVAHQRVLRS